MVNGCSALKELNLNKFNAGNVTEKSGVFKGCLDELKLKIKNKFNNFKIRLWRLNIYKINKFSLKFKIIKFRHLNNL